MRRRCPNLAVPIWTLALATSACAQAPAQHTASAQQQAPARQVIAPAGASAIAPYSPAIRSGGFVFLSGQIGLLPGTTDLARGGITAETRQALENVRTILDAAGLAPADVVKCTVFLADIAEFGAMNEVYGAFFSTAPPARSTLGVAALPLGARVEIECIARDRT